MIYKEPRVGMTCTANELSYRVDKIEGNTVTYDLINGKPSYGTFGSVDQWEWYQTNQKWVMTMPHKPIIVVRSKNA